ncbi:uncharacterized protein LOC110255325 [Sus scrofa]|uniref:uncharacterized protein LOC110255325 n=1 Tax=Sus scrofa TaxID=9823 RepID=UPI000A2B42CD|nr:uncharacterized protein LOC110255325 [Sus scrofa]
MQLFTALLAAPRGSFRAPKQSLFGPWSLGSGKEGGGLGGLSSSSGGFRAARPRRSFLLARAATGEARPRANHTARGVRSSRSAQRAAAKSRKRVPAAAAAPEEGRPTGGKSSHKGALPPARRRSQRGTRVFAPPTHKSGEDPS